MQSPWGRKELDTTEQLSLSFIIFNAILNGNVLLILFSDYSLQGNRNTVDFVILILYAMTLLNSLLVLIIFSRFLVIFIIQCHVVHEQRQFYFFPTCLFPKTHVPQCSLKHYLQ